MIAVISIAYLLIAAQFWHFASRHAEERLLHQGAVFNVVLLILCVLWPAAFVYALFVLRKGDRGRDSDK